MVIHFTAYLTAVSSYLVKALPLDNVWKHGTSNPPAQNRNPPGSACRFPTEDRLLKEASTPCHFHLPFAASHARALPTISALSNQFIFRNAVLAREKHYFLRQKKFRAGEHLHCGYLSGDLDGLVLALYFKVALH